MLLTTFSIYKFRCWVMMESVGRRVCKIAKSHCWLHHIWTSVCPSARIDSTLAGRIFIKLDIWVFLKKKNVSRKLKFDSIHTRITGTLRCDRSIFIKISCWIIPRTRHALGKFVEKNRTYILCFMLFFRKSCRLLDNVENCATAWQVGGDNLMQHKKYALYK